MDIKKLSEVASVTVTKQGDVKFMVIPKYLLEDIGLVG